MLRPWRIYFYLIYGGSASRAFAEWQRETTLPESGSYSMGWARVKAALRVLSVSIDLQAQEGANLVL
jgi:hypothetical protein